MRPDGENTYRLIFSGLLLKDDMSQCEAALKSELARRGSAKLLCVLEAFEGWEPRADWNDLAFYMQHGDAITRIAIVGDERWRSLALMFAAADLRRAPVEFFLEHELERARAWLSV